MGSKSSSTTSAVDNRTGVTDQGIGVSSYGGSGNIGVSPFSGLRSSLNNSAIGTAPLSGIKAQRDLKLVTGNNTETSIKTGNQTSIAYNTLDNGAIESAFDFAAKAMESNTLTQALQNNEISKSIASVIESQKENLASNSALSDNVNNALKNVADYITGSFGDVAGALNDSISTAINRTTETNAAAASATVAAGEAAAAESSDAAAKTQKWLIAAALVIGAGWFLLGRKGAAA